MSRTKSSIFGRLTIVAAIVYALTLYVTTAFGASPYTGQWTVEKSSKPGEVHMMLRYERHGNGNSYNSMQSFDLPMDKAVGLTAAVMESSGTKGQFKLVRDAGTFICDGWFNGGNGAGTFDFQGNPQFAAELQKRGVGTPSEEQQFRLASGDASLELVDTLKAAKYDFDVEDLIRTVNHGVSLSYIREVNQLGYRPESLVKLIKMRDHGVDPEYIKSIQASGLKNLPADEMIHLRDHGVTSDYIHGLSQFGINDLSAESLTRLRDHGVDPEYIAGMRKAGYKATPEDLTRMRDHGVSVDFIQELMAQKVSDLSVSDLVRLRDHGVDAEYIAEMRKTGINADPNELARMRDHGVSPDFVSSVREAGFTNLTPSELERLRDHGVDASYLRQHGKGRTIEQVIRMHDTGAENEVL